MAGLAQLKLQQQALAAQVICDGIGEDWTPRLIAGGDTGFEQNGTIARGVIVLLQWPSLEVVEFRVARVPVTLPYIPGYLSFRECPALLSAWQQLSQQPDMMFIDGQGIAHPRGLGLASHFGVIADIPVIGVAKRRLCGDYEPPGPQPGDCQPLTFRGSQTGWVMRNKARCLPLFISPGHKISLQSARHWTERCLRGYRLPEPTRIADAIASQRKGFQRYTG
ncbi:deoxyribonuclease V [Tatumella saanichensis]|uniref:deoxyribonuclease V n=1 Tax=Tatumella saanichensis TaxID=480813 RepID=UPI0004A41430|nr:deoxyribonuclease V [Tatumella saanichensis]